ncbi:MAG TPA: hypothetical protein VEH27_12800 [Methylomirabilota bacterium]|nr:hypothetical protein [Methylomirabilota bacterium]
MDWQQPVALSIVAGTALIFAWQRFHRRKNRSCNSGCCDSKSTPPTGTVVFKARRGERAQIIVKPG